jgi:hypothetical protein
MIRALLCTLLVGVTGCPESVNQVHSSLPVLLGPVDHIGGTAATASPSLGPINAEIHRQGGTGGQSIDLSSIDTAIAFAASRSGLGPNDGDVHVAALHSGGYIFYAIPYLPYPVLFGRTWMHLEGNVTAAGGAR